MQSDESSWPVALSWRGKPRERKAEFIVAAAMPLLFLYIHCYSLPLAASLEICTCGHLDWIGELNRGGG
jgi:hypothetical protein